MIIPQGSEIGWNISSTLLNGTGLEGHSSIYLPGSLLRDALGGQDLENCSLRVITSLWNVNPSLLQVNDSATVDGDAEPLVHGMWYVLCCVKMCAPSNTAHLFLFVKGKFCFV